MANFLLAKNFRGKGFTLLEILYALSIISILAAIAIMNYAGYRKKAYDTAAQEDLRQAYSSAINYFIDHPRGVLTLSDLGKYGFRVSPNVKVMIINGRLSSLFLISSYDASGAQTYRAYREGLVQPGNSDPISQEPSQTGGGGAGGSTGSQNNNPGGIGSQQGNLTVNSDVTKICNQATLMDLTQAYNAALAYLAKNPGETVTNNTLLANGYIPNENISLVVLNGTPSNLSMSASFNFPGTANYTIGPSGISSSAP